jgi:Membrane bound beta barrel domain (DUF5777)
MINIKNFGLVFLALITQITYAQDDMLEGIDSTTSNQKVTSAFKALKIVNLESTKLVAKGDLYLVIAHRFGSVKDGIKGFFGLDNAVTQIKFVYGLSDNFNIAAARSEQAYDFSAKYTIASQIENGFPLSIVGFNSLGINNLLNDANYPKLKSQNKLIYVNQLLISRKFSKNFSFELAPTYFHENFVIDDNQSNSQFAMGLGGRYKISKRVSINMDYAAHLNRASTSNFNNPLSVGVDIETGGHVFQMHFSNSQGIHESGFLANTSGDWTTGNIFFGFNLVRVF